MHYTALLDYTINNRQVLIYLSCEDGELKTRHHHRLFTLCVLAAAMGAPIIRGDELFHVERDLVGDAVIRRMDMDADGPVDSGAHRLPDIVSYRIGMWVPTDPQGNSFDGEWSPESDILRLDIVFDGLVNPPGTLCCEHPFDPFVYGPNPVFGYIEIDMDDSVNTGGELYKSHGGKLHNPHLRYLGNAARFGGVSSED